jgi:hypothetical protein
MHKDHRDSVVHHESYVRFSYHAYCEYKYFHPNKQQVSKNEKLIFQKKMKLYLFTERLSLTARIVFEYAYEHISVPALKLHTFSLRGA